VGTFAVIAGYVAAMIVTWWLYSRRPDYRKIHRMERQLGYRDLTVPVRRPRRRRRR
jgi:hypothetical protein